MPIAFVTGGSGFVGGALIRRLVAAGWPVRALARSPRSAAAVRAAGAEPVTGDLHNLPALDGTDVAFHCAAFVERWGTRADYEAANVTGTRNVVEACRKAGTPRLVHVGTEAAVLAGQPLHEAGEDVPLRPDSKSLYCATKAMAERVVRDAGGDGLRTVVVRPRLIWGPGDRTILPALADSVRRGRFRWIGPGTHLTSTTHVDNAVHGLMLAATAADPGPVYFVTDGPPAVFRDFITSLLATAGVTAPDGHVPPRAAALAAAGAEGAWRVLRLPGAPPITRTEVWLSSLECTLDIGRARAELGYQPVITREAGLSDLAAGPGTAGSAGTPPPPPGRP
ncbi:NAD-dependent epimerase/dehydratase family protein [Actinoplanes sp. NPDC049596]|uniref:NAD-dependent epimerase/dehydratase family protein n=1 Tax=unclassified Actinoplanes TaxID=2626549 RepID=UPI003444E731